MRTIEFTYERLRGVDDTVDVEYHKPRYRSTESSIIEFDEESGIEILSIKKNGVDVQLSQKQTRKLIEYIEENSEGDDYYDFVKEGE